MIVKWFRMYCFGFDRRGKAKKTEIERKEREGGSREEKKNSKRDATTHRERERERERERLEGEGKEKFLLSFSFFNGLVCLAFCFFRVDTASV